MQTLKAWHFVSDTIRDGRPIPADGVKLVHTGPLVLCESGLHASLQAFDALTYAPGNTLCLVECGGIIKQDTDKLICTERTIIARMDAEPLLWYFARMQALSVAHLWDAPQIVCDYLMTGDEGIREASWDASWDAAGAASWDAARAAARAEFNALITAEFEDWI